MRSSGSDLRRPDPAAAAPQAAEASASFVRPPVAAKASASPAAAAAVTETGRDGNKSVFGASQLANATPTKPGSRQEATGSSPDGSWVEVEEEGEEEEEKDEEEEEKQRRHNYGKYHGCVSGVMFSGMGTGWRRQCVAGPQHYG